MATATIPQPRNQLVDIADLLTKIVPLFVSTEQQKSGTSTQTSTIDPTVLAQGNQLYSQLLERGSSTAQADEVVKDILYRAQLAFAPVLGEEKASGVYNSTTKALLGNEAIARATAAASNAVLQSQEQALQQATALVNARTSATRSVTTSENSANRTPAPVSGKNAAIGLLGTLASGQVSGLVKDLKKKKSEETPPTPPSTDTLDYLKELFGLGGDADLTTFQTALNAANPETVAFAANNPSIISAINGGGATAPGAFDSALSGLPEFNSLANLYSNLNIAPGTAAEATVADSADITDFTYGSDPALFEEGAGFEYTGATEAADALDAAIAAGTAIPGAATFGSGVVSGASTGANIGAFGESVGAGFTGTEVAGTAGSELAGLSSLGPAGIIAAAVYGLSQPQMPFNFSAPLHDIASQIFAGYGG